MVDRNRTKTEVAKVRKIQITKAIRIQAQFKEILKELETTEETCLADVPAVLRSSVVLRRRQGSGGRLAPRQVFTLLVTNSRYVTYAYVCQR